jgi:hypothetical protein
MGECIAVAMVLDRYYLLMRAWGTIAESIRRLGPEWTLATLRVRRHSGQDEVPLPLAAAPVERSGLDFQTAQSRRFSRRW